MRKNKLLTIFAVLVFAFLIIPLIIITVTAFGGGNAITFPIESFSMKWFLNVFSLKSFRKSFLTSLEIAFLATFIALLVGIPAAYALARSGIRDLKVGVPVAYHCSGYCHRFCALPVSCAVVENSGVCGTSGRPFHGDASICDPGGRIESGPV